MGIQHEMDRLEKRIDVLARALEKHLKDHRDQPGPQDQGLARAVQTTGSTGTPEQLEMLAVFTDVVRHLSCISLAEADSTTSVLEKYEEAVRRARQALTRLQEWTR